MRRERLHRVLNILGFLPNHYSEKIDFEKHPGQFKKGEEPKLNYVPHWNDAKGKYEYEFLFKESFNEMVEELKKSQPQIFHTKKDGSEVKVPYDWTIYYLRKKALRYQLTKEELAWVILNFNQKRGYYQLRGEDEEQDSDKKKSFEILKVKEVIDSGEVIKGKNIKLYYVYFENHWRCY